MGNVFPPGAPNVAHGSLPRPPASAGVAMPMNARTMPMSVPPTNRPQAPTSTIDAAFGAPFVTAPSLPARNDAPQATWFGQPAPPQTVPPRKESLTFGGSAFGGGGALPSTDWLVPLASRNKYRSQFAMNDPGNTNLIGASVARNLLLQTKVDTNILARIWSVVYIKKNLACDVCDTCLGTFLT